MLEDLNDSLTSPAKDTKRGINKVVGVKERLYHRHGDDQRVRLY